jgi:hypothetical protein
VAGRSNRLAALVMIVLPVLQHFSLQRCRFTELISAMLTKKALQIPLLHYEELHFLGMPNPQAKF